MLVLGHRGTADTACPENTLAAVDLALQLGADGVEVDVRLTADGVPVCHHDPGLRRTAGDARSVASVRREQLPLIRGHRIPALDEVIDLVADRGRLVVEVKTPHWPAGATTCTVDAVAHVLRRHRLHDVVVSSFDRPRVLALRALDLPVRTALLGRAGVPLAVLLRRAIQDRHDEAHPHAASLLSRLDLVRSAAAQGISMTGWTVDRPQDLQRLAEAGAHAAICNDVGAARDAVAMALAG